MKTTSIVLMVSGIFLGMSSASPMSPKGSSKASEKGAKVEKLERDLASPKTGEEVRAAAKAQADLLSDKQKAALLRLLNQGEAGELQEIKGVGKKRAEEIIAKRPYAKIEDVALLGDIGEKTYGSIISFGKGEQVTTKDPATTKGGGSKEKAMKP